MLDTESISSFVNGVYLDWKVSGDLVIKISRTAGNNAVLNGVFLDPPAAAPTATFIEQGARRRRGAGRVPTSRRGLTSSPGRPA